METAYNIFLCIPINEQQHHTTMSTTFTITLKVSDNWTDDGLDLTTAQDFDHLMDVLKNLNEYRLANEVSFSVKKHVKPRAIGELEAKGLLD